MYALLSVILSNIYIIEGYIVMYALLRVILSNVCIIEGYIV